MTNSLKAAAGATTIYFVTVRDTFCGVRGRFEESCLTTNKTEADTWLKQWKSEYDKDSGYKVTMKKTPYSDAAWQHHCAIESL